MNFDPQEQIELLRKKLGIDIHIPTEDNAWMFDCETFTKNSEYYKKNGHVSTNAIYGEHLWSDRNFEGITPSDFKNFLLKESKRQSITIYFHNLRFDISYLLKELINDCNIVYKKSTDKRLTLKAGEFTNFVNEFGQVYFYKFRFLGCKYQVNFKDSWKLFPKSIADLAPYTPFKKFEDIDFDTIQEVKEFKEHCQDVKERIINDVAIGKYMLKKRFSTPMPKGLTSASIAMKDLRKEIGLNWDEKYGCIADYETWLNFKDSYKGGAVLVHEKHRNKPIILKGKNKGIMQDIKSSYPHQAVNYDQPYGLPVPKTDKTLQLLKVRITGIKIKKNKIPCLLIDNNGVCRKRELITENENVITFSIWENEFNFLKNNVYDIEKLELLKEWSFQCDKTISLWFAKMFEYKYYYNLIDDKAMEEVYKLSINSALGKFGQNPYSKIKRIKLEVIGDILEENKKIQCNNEKHQDNRKIRWKTLDGMVHECIDEEMSSTFSYVPLVSHITSGARLQLFEYINYKDNGKYFVYSDTDSVLFTHADKIELPPHHKLGNDLGNWALELYDITYINVIREKGYRVIGKNPKTKQEYVKTRMSGLPQKIADEVSNGDFKIGYKTKILKNETTEHGNALVDTTFEIKATYKKRGI